MARKILCPACNKETSANANKFNELYESIGGKAKSHYKCDNCGTPISKGVECFAGCLLPSINHPNYESQKPEEWASGYVLPAQGILSQVK